jgi:hypothetical protein
MSSHFGDAEIELRRCKAKIGITTAITTANKLVATPNTIPLMRTGMRER